MTTLKAVLQVEQEIDKLHEQFQQDVQRIEKDVETTLEQLKQESATILINYKKEKQDLLQQEMATLRKQVLSQEQEEIEQLKTVVDNQKEVLIDAITKEVMTRYGRF